MTTSTRQALHDDLGTIESRDTRRLEIGMIVRTVALMLGLHRDLHDTKRCVEKNPELVSAQASAPQDSELRSRRIFEESARHPAGESERPADRASEQGFLVCWAVAVSKSLH